MPTIALSNSVSYCVLSERDKDGVKVFPRIRVFGTIGFIASMWLIDLLGYKDSYNQFFTAAVWGAIMSLYSLSMPDCPPSNSKGRRGFLARLGLDAFRCFAQKRLAIFFIFSMLLGCALQISNGFTSVYLSSFASEAAYADTFAVQHPIIMTSLSQISETLCILLIPFFLGRFGIKRLSELFGIDLVIEFYVEQLIYTLSSDGKRECKGHSGMGIKSFGVPKGCLCADERTFHGAAEVEMGYKLQ
jgi:NHS family xanthosine MFS transporter